LHDVSPGFEALRNLNTNRWKVGTQKRHTYQKESTSMAELRSHARASARFEPPYPEPPEQLDPALEALVREIIGRVADKWTMLALETLAEHGRLRFVRLGQLIGGVSQKMLTKTLRQMEADGLVSRTVFPVVPPRVEYELTDLGQSLGAAFCGVWIWAAQHREVIMKARQAFAERGS
jgi:DNA-binding HxlR family transcriptional regulator